MTEIRGRVWAEYHQFYLMSPQNDELAAATEDNRLLAPMPGGGAIVTTGVSLGGVRYAARPLREAPVLESDGWEDIVEATISVPDGVLNVVGWAAGSVDERNLASAGPGMYRVRAYARDRLAQYDLSALRAKERFMFEIWPATGDEPPVSVLLASEFIDR